ncbi:hypothetical protein BH09ACT4_BH09ACT4_14800 [soil metagenome]
MFAVIADQIGSRAAVGHVDAQIAAIAELAGGHLVQPADRIAADDIQAATEDAATALAIALRLTRDGNWCVGLGIGEDTAFGLARNAVDAAKKSPTRFALAMDAGRLPDARLLQPLIDLLLQLRARRTPEGWEVAEQLVSGTTQAQLAARLGVTPQAISLRVQNAQLHTERAAIASLVELLEASGEPPQHSRA